MYLCKILQDIQIYLCAESVFLSEFKPALLQKIGLYQIIRDGGSLAKRNKTNLSICLGSPPPVLDLLLLLPDHDSTVHNFLSQEFYTVSCQGFFWVFLDVGASHLPTYSVSPLLRPDSLTQVPSHLRHGSASP